MGIANMFLFAGMLTNVDPALISAICYVESKHNKDAYVEHDGHSPSYGICQVKLSTAKGLGFKGNSKALQEPYTNVLYAAKYLQRQFKRYGNWDKAISAYNAGRAIRGNSAYVAKVNASRGASWSVLQYANAVRALSCNRTSHSLFIIAAAAK